MTVTVVGGLLGIVWLLFVAATLFEARSAMRAGRAEVDAARVAARLAVRGPRALPGLGRA